MAGKKRVAILGGGIAGLTAAYELTRTEALRMSHDVTVYQMGWRLGGKGASGRDPDTKRIEEHGLHIWFGFYDNAFNMIKEVYESVGRPPDHPLATWQQAFKGATQIVLEEQLGGGDPKVPFKDQWSPLVFNLPPHGSEPGGYTGARPAMWSVLDQMVTTALDNWGPWAEKISEKGIDPNGKHQRPRHPARARLVGAAAASRTRRGLMELASGAERVVFRKPRHEPGWITSVADSLLSPVDHLLRPLERDLVRTLQTLDDIAWEHFYKKNIDEPGFRQFCAGIDLAAAIAAGVTAAVPSSGVFSDEGTDLDDWFGQHGARPFTLQQSGLVRAIYDMAFGLRGSYPARAMDRRTLDADTGLLDLMRLIFTYHGAFYYKMQAGMGDTVFAPLYSVLKDRGVRFEFFQRVDRLGLDTERGVISSIRMVKQAQLKPGSEYDPLVEVKGIPCWPNQPKWDLLVSPLPSEDGDDRVRQVEALSRSFESGMAMDSDDPPQTLLFGDQFDLVVLAIPIAALGPICSELIADNPSFRSMVDNSHTVMTQAFQTWLTKSPVELGWPHGEGSIVTSFLEPVDTYCDMGQLIEREDWPPSAQVQGLAYFCGVLPDFHNGKPITTQEEADIAVRENAADLLEHHSDVYWNHDSLRLRTSRQSIWDILAGAGAESGKARFDEQYFRANFAPTERYTQTPAGSVQYRLWPEESGYTNLFLAGDWTRTPLNAGCIEAAVMSGMRCAHKLSPASTRSISGSHPDWLVPSSMSSNQTKPPKQTSSNSDRQAPMPSKRTPYLSYGGLATVPGPFECRDVVTYAFWLQADRERLIDLSNRLFDPEGTGSPRYTPLSDHLMLTFGTTNVASLNPTSEWPFEVSYKDMGYSPERNAALWMLLGSKTEAAVFSPVMWVDNPVSLVGGREIYGHAKNFGRLSIEEDERHFRVEAFGGNFGQTNETGFYEVVSMSSAGDLKVLDVPLDFAHIAFRIVEEHLKGFGLGIADATFFHHILEDLRRRRLRQLFLRQFRSPPDGTTTDVRQMLIADSTFGALPDVKVLPFRYRFDLTDIDSHPLGKQMGLRSQSVDFGLRISGDFVLGEGSDVTSVGQSE